MVNLSQVKFVFYHIPKCGGTSFREILFEYFLKIYKKEGDIYLPRLYENINLERKVIDNLNSKYEKKLKNIKVILSHTQVYEFPELLNDKIFKFTIIRNPIDRMISHYYFFDFKRYNLKLIDQSDEFINHYSKVYGNFMLRYLNLLENGKINIDKIKIFLKNFTVLILEDIDIDNFNKKLNIFFEVDIKLKLKYINKNLNNKKIELNDQNFINKIKNYFKYDLIFYNIVKEFTKEKEKNDSTIDYILQKYKN